MRSRVPSVSYPIRSGSRPRVLDDVLVPMRGVVPQLRFSHADWRGKLVLHACISRVPVPSTWSLDLVILIVADSTDVLDRVPDIGRNRSVERANYGRQSAGQGCQVWGTINRLHSFRPAFRDGETSRSKPDALCGSPRACGRRSPPLSRSLLCPLSRFLGPE